MYILIVRINEYMRLLFVKFRFTPFPPTRLSPTLWTRRLPMKACTAVFLTLFFVGCSNPKPEQPAVKPADENAVVQLLTDLGKAQNDFHTRTRRYALTF